MRNTELSVLQWERCILTSMPTLIYYKLMSKLVLPVLKKKKKKKRMYLLKVVKEKKVKEQTATH